MFRFDFLALASAAGYRPVALSKYRELLRQMCALNLLNASVNARTVLLVTFAALLTLKLMRRCGAAVCMCRVLRLTVYTRSGVLPVDLPMILKTWLLVRVWNSYVTAFLGEGNACRD